VTSSPTAYETSFSFIYYLLASISVDYRFTKDVPKTSSGTQVVTPKIDANKIEISRQYRRLILCMEDFMTSGVKKRFPVRLKAEFPTAVSSEAMPRNMKYVPSSVSTKIVPFPCFSRCITKTYPAILIFPVRAL